MHPQEIIGRVVEGELLARKALLAAAPERRDRAIQFLLERGEAGWKRTYASPYMLIPMDRTTKLSRLYRPQGRISAKP